MEKEIITQARVKVRKVGESGFVKSKGAPVYKVFKATQEVFTNLPEQLFFSTFTFKVTQQTIRPQAGDRLKIDFFVTPETPEIQRIINEVYHDIWSEEGNYLTGFASLQSLKVLTDIKKGVVFFEEENCDDILMGVLEENIEGVLLNASFEEDEDGSSVAVLDDQLELFDFAYQNFKAMEPFKRENIEDEEENKPFEKWCQNLLFLSEQYLEKWNNPAEVALYRDALNVLPKEDYRHLQDKVRQNILEENFISPLELILPSQKIEALDTKAIC